MFPAEAEPYHRVLDGPVPVFVDVQPLEQLLAAFEQGLQGAEQQALAETAWAGKKVASPLRDQLPDQGGLVDLVASLVAQGGEGLDAERQLTAFCWRVGVHSTTFDGGGATKPKNCSLVQAFLTPFSCSCWQCILAISSRSVARLYCAVRGGSDRTSDSRGYPSHFLALRNSSSQGLFSESFSSVQEN